MDRPERGYTIGISDIIAVNGAAFVALALFVRIAMVAIGGI